MEAGISAVGYCFMLLPYSSRLEEGGAKQIEIIIKLRPIL